MCVRVSVFVLYKVLVLAKRYTRPLLTSKHILITDTQTRRMLRSRRFCQILFIHKRRFSHQLFQLPPLFFESFYLLQVTKSAKVRQGLG